MNTQPNSIPDLISRWATIVDFSRSVGCGYEAARQMRRRGSIAPDHWPNVIRAAKLNGICGVTYKWLASQRAKEERAA